MLLCGRELLKGEGGCGKEARKDRGVLNMFLAKHTNVDVISLGEGIMETLVDFNEG